VTTSRAVLLVLLLAAAPARAEDGVDAGAAEPASIEPALDGAAAPAPDADAADATPPAPNFLVPALEVPVINIGIWAFARYALDADYARISPASMRSNLTGRWVIDEDGFEVNQLGHPYQGSMSFAGARSAGVGFWTSTLYTFSASLMWELLMETDPPSLNDQVTTVITGALRGEALHRLSAVVLDRPGEGGWRRELLAGLVSPMRLANRLFFGLRHVEPTGETRLLGSFHAGLTAIGGVEELRDGVVDVERLGRILTVGARVIYGLPGPDGFELKQPFDHFHLDVELNLGRQPFGRVHTSGAIWGRTFGTNGLRALGGLYGFYEFYNPTPFRSSVGALGPGMTVVVGERVPVYLVVANGFVPVGAAGLSEAEGRGRDYHFGVGNLAHAHAGVVVPGRLWASLAIDHVYLNAVRDARGYENLLYADARLEVRVAGCHGAGVRWSSARRVAEFEEVGEAPLRQARHQLRIYWAWLIGRPAELGCRD
jgi:hypothetical protein